MTTYSNAAGFWAVMAWPVQHEFVNTNLAEAADHVGEAPGRHPGGQRRETNQRVANAFRVAAQLDAQIIEPVAAISRRGQELLDGLDLVTTKRTPRVRMLAGNPEHQGAMRCFGRRCAAA